MIGDLGVVGESAHLAQRVQARQRDFRWWVCESETKPALAASREKPVSKTPSIKGSIVANHAEVLQKYLAKAQLSERELARRFEPGDLEVLAGPIDPTRWYDVRLYKRLLEFLRDHPGEGRNEYLIEAGRRSAENLIRAGIHQQLEYLRRTQHKEAIEPAERFGPDCDVGIDESDDVGVGRSRGGVPPDRGPLFR